MNWFQEILYYIESFFFHYDCQEPTFVGQSIPCKKEFKWGSLALVLVIGVIIYLIFGK